MSMRKEAPVVSGERIRSYLDAQSSVLEPATLDRINRDRRAALAELKSRRAVPMMGWVAGAALAGIGALALLPALYEPSVPPAPVSMEAFSALASPAEVDVIESLDFYLWAAAEEELGDDEAG